MKIGIFGGTFNPIHIGHAIIANYVIQHCGIDRLWLMVSPLNPFKEAQGECHNAHRLRMVDMVTRRIDNVETSGFEFALPRPSYTIDTLKGKQITQTKRAEMAGSDKGKLLPTDIGIEVNEFLMQYFPAIMDYNFTAKVEQKFDEIAEGTEQWTDMMKEFYSNFEPEVEKTMNIRAEHKAGERELGKDPKSGKPVFVKIGRFGPVVQIGTADDEEKPQFAQLPTEMSMESITLEEAMELFKLPRQVGKYEGTPITIGAGRFGPYVMHDKKFVSIPKNIDPLEITQEQAINLIVTKRNAEEQSILKTFEEQEGLQIRTGRFGPYIACNGKNFKIPRSMAERAAELTIEECRKIMSEPPKKKAKK